MKQLIKLSTRMSMDELREELDDIIMTRGTSRDLVVLAEAVSRLITLSAPRVERDEFERKGKELCTAYGNALITIHDLQVEITRLKAK